MFQMNLSAKQKQRHRCRKLNGYKVGKKGWDERGAWDRHIYTTDATYETDN